MEGTICIQLGPMIAQECHQLMTLRILERRSILLTVLFIHERVFLLCITSRPATQGSKCSDDCQEAFVGDP
jgi:hypothetical protein